MLSMAIVQEWWKRNGDDATLGIGVFFLIFMAFLAGRISVVSQEKEPVIIDVPDMILQKQAEIQGMPLTDLAAPDGTISPTTRGIPTRERRGKYVASKNGKYYYAADMSMAARIKPDNRIWFGSPQEAEAKGFRAAKEPKN